MNSAMPVLTKQVTDARIIWNILNGVFVLYKPPLTHNLKVRHTILGKICNELNSMHVRPPKNHVVIKGDTNKPMEVIVQPSYADHTSVVGPRYQTQDIKLSFANRLERDTSGVLVCGINRGTRLIYKLQQSKPTKFYRVKGIFGQATDNCFKTGKIVEKTTYKHIRRNNIDRLCGSMQSSHQRKMFELSGVDIQSQAAYELAVQGPVRPADSRIPMIYTIKCTHFEPPDFTLEIVCVNEYEMYLKTIIHDLGMRLHSTATCTQIQCFQYGLFNVDNALLSKHWDLQALIRNMKVCQDIIDKNQYLLDQDSPILVEQNSSETSV